jgi:hypothetical protein
VNVGFRAVLLGATVVALAGCFKNPGSGALPQASVDIPITPVYDYADVLNSYLHAAGACNGNSQIEFSYFSDLNTTATVIKGDCVVDKLDTKLNITSPDKPQDFTVTITPILRGNRGRPSTVIVHYRPPAPLTPGFSILSGGGATSNAQTQIFSSIGEVVSPATIKDPSGNTLRTGVQGVNDP